MIPKAAAQLNQSLWNRRPSQAAPIARTGEPRRSFLLAWLPLMLLPCTAIALRGDLPPWGLMWALAFSLYFGLKWLTWWRVWTSIPHSRWRDAAYLLAWPGMDAQSFLDETNHAPAPRLSDWLRPFLKTGLGVSLIWFIARLFSPAHPLLRGWTAMLGLILLLHFGVFHMLALFWQRLGVAAEPIMRAPLRARSLVEFWGRRWNLGFRQLAHDLLFVPVHKRLPATFASLMVFVASGLLHDLVISVPAQGGYGLPTAYFLLQGVGIIVERSSFGRQVGLGKGLRGFLFLLLIAAGPVFVLFHPAFVIRVIIPFLQAVHAL
jgi:membrane bound O-acyltransferase family protein